MKRHSPWETEARRLDASDGGAIDILAFEMVPSWAVQEGDLILCTIGDVVPATGEVVEGEASVARTDVTRTTAPSPQVTVSAGAAATRGDKVQSGWIVVRAGNTSFA